MWAVVVVVGRRPSWIVVCPRRRTMSDVTARHWATAG